LGSVARITVASYNVHWGHDKSGRRPFDIVEVCKVLDADLLVLQEAWRPDDGEGQVDRAASELEYTITRAEMGRGVIRHSRHRFATGARSAGWLEVAVLSRLPVRSSRVVDMLHSPLDLAPRRVAVVVETEVGHQGFTFVGTHLDHLTHGSPWQLRRLAAELPGREVPAALAGDMNMWGPVLSALLPGWSRAVRGRTWPNRRPHSQIDHIVVTPVVRALSGEVVRAGRSDHLPVRAVLDF
jgi:endonuclease/exonuclease/phosphatase family metal-dependent hydrolase